jgi:hypothetical protein
MELGDACTLAEGVWPPVALLSPGPDDSLQGNDRNGAEPADSLQADRTQAEQRAGTYRANKVYAFFRRTN